jgi:hypothetical protein
MRLISPGANPPGIVDRYLLPHEQEVITLRRHPALLFPWAAAFIGGLLVTIAMTSIAHEGTVQLVAWLLTAFLGVEMVVAALRWGTTFIVFTSHRLLICSGATGRRITEKPLTSLKGIGLHQPPSGQIFGYGTFELPDRTSISYMPYPEQIYLEVLALLYGPPIHPRDGEDD